jgi:hypothetical protein
MNAAPTVITTAATPAVPGDYEKLKQEFDSVVTSKIGRWVASGIALAVPLLTGLCAWLQKEIGINLDPASLTAFIASMAAGISITGYKWLSNRGDWERLAVEGYQLYLTGQSATATTNQVIVTAPASPPAAGGGG